MTRRRWLTTPEAAPLLGCDRTTAAYLARTGVLRARKRGPHWYLDPESVAAYQARPVRWQARAEAIRDAGEKRCTRCRLWLSLPAFSRSSRYLDGRCPVCRRCMREYHLGHRPGPPDRALPQWPPGRPA